MSYTTSDKRIEALKDKKRQLISAKQDLERRIDELCQENERLRKYAHTLEATNLDVTARLQDYIGQYNPTDAFVAEVKAENAKLYKENERLRAEQVYWELGNCPSCPNVVSLQEALEQNTKLRELVDELYPLADYGAMDASELDKAYDLMRELGIEAGV